MMNDEPNHYQQGSKPNPINVHDDTSDSCVAPAHGMSYNYGMPNPQWSLKDRFEVEDYRKAIDTYMQHSDPYDGDRMHKFYSRCNAELADDLLSENEELIKRAAEWIQKGFIVSKDLSTLIELLGEFNAWQVIEYVALSLCWRRNVTIERLARVLTREMGTILLSENENEKTKILLWLDVFDYDA